MYRVMLVDDEQNILNALRRCLALIDATQIDGDAVVVETFTSPEAALERGEERDFDLVLSDYRMPSMNGVEFLTRFMKLQPEVPRMIVSAFADREAIITAINETNLSRFIQKPWNDEELRATVTAILSSKGSDRNPQLQKNLDITDVERGEDGGITIDLDDDEDFFK